MVAVLFGGAFGRPANAQNTEVLFSSLGRSIPVALFEVGKKAPTGPMQLAFEASHREWMLSTDFGRAIRVLKDNLADPTADMICETLAIAHELGGSDLEKRLNALIEDRRIDLRNRKEAISRQAGAKFARYFVLVVPLGMAMIGLTMPETRELLEDAVKVITHLLTSEDPISFTNGRWTLKNALLHLRPYSNLVDTMTIAAVASPAGPRLAGQYGHGLLSIGATTAVGFDLLAHHWDVMEERAAHYDTHVSRDKWRLVGMMHLAPTREQAYREVEHGIAAWFEYFQHTAAFPQMGMGDGTTVQEYIDFVNESGLGTIGTPDDACDQIDRLVKQSNGGFGAYLQLAHDWADSEAKFRSYELFARHVAPRFQGQRHATIDAKHRAAVQSEVAVVEGDEFEFAQPVTQDTRGAQCRT